MKKLLFFTMLLICAVSLNAQVDSIKIIPTENVYETSLNDVNKIIKNNKKPFNNFKFKSEQIVLNTTNVPYLDTIIHSGLYYLPIKNIIIQIKDFEKCNLKSYDNNYDAHIIKHEDYYIIYIKKFSKFKYITILSHELIHLKQHYNNELKLINKNTSIWKGDTINVNSYKYDDRPWEEDALNNQYELEKKMKQKLFKK